MSGFNEYVRRRIKAYQDSLPSFGALLKAAYSRGDGSLPVVICFDGHVHIIPQDAPIEAFAGLCSSFDDVNIYVPRGVRDEIIETLWHYQARIRVLDSCVFYDSEAKGNHES